MAESAIDLDVPPGTALVAIGRTAEDWGGEFTRQGEGGRLRLPVLAGLRRGLVTGTITVLPTEAGSRVVFRPEEVLVSAHFQSVAVLVLSAAGALVTVLWPFFPKLMPVAPFGILSHSCSFIARTAAGAVGAGYRTSAAPG